MNSLFPLKCNSGDVLPVCTPFVLVVNQRSHDLIYIRLISFDKPLRCFMQLSLIYGTILGSLFFLQSSKHRFFKQPILAKNELNSELVIYYRMEYIVDRRIMTGEIHENSANQKLIRWKCFVEDTVFGLATRMLIWR